MLLGKFFAVGVLENVEALAIRLHHPVLDAVVHHLDEVACAGGSTMNVAVFGCAAGDLFSSRRAANFAASGCQRLENWIETSHRVFGAADHHAIAAIDAPNAAAGSDVHVIDAFGFQLPCTADVIFEIGIAAIDDGVAALHSIRQGLDSLFGRIAGWDHDPGCPRRLEIADELVERCGTQCSLTYKFLDWIGAAIGNHQLMPAAQHSARHIRAHFSQTYHSELHVRSLRIVPERDFVQALSGAGAPAGVVRGPQDCMLPALTLQPNA